MRYLKKLILCFLIFQTTAAQTQDEGSGLVYIDSFGGLNNFFESSKIENSDAQAVENILTDRGFLEKRTGNVRSITALSGSAVKWIKEFISTGGTRFFIVHASGTVYQTDLSGDLVSLSTVSATLEVDSVSGFGRHYVVNGSDPGFSWDTASTSTVTGMPLCRYVEFADERLYCANTAVSGSEVRVSSFGADNSWTIPATRTRDSPDGFFFDQDDGEEITCFKATPYGKFVGKRNKTFVLKGYDTETYYKRLVHPNIGCIDDRSVQMLEGNVIWLALDGIYAWDGANPPRSISKEIEPTVLSIRQINSQVGIWTVNSQNDWQDGTIPLNGSTDSWNATFTPGSIFPSTSAFQDTSQADFSSGTIENVIFADRTIASISTRAPVGSISLAVTSVGFNNSTFETQLLSGWTLEGGPGPGALATVVAASGMYGSNAMAMEVCDFYLYDNLLEIIDAVNNNVLLSGNIHSPDTTTVEQNTVTLHGLSVSSSNVRVRIQASSGIRATSPSFFLGQVLVFRSDRNTGVAASTTCTSNGGGPNSTQILFDMNDTAVSRLTSGTITSRSYDTLFSTPTYGPFDVTLTSSASDSVAFQTQTSSDNSNWGTFTAVTNHNRPTSNAVNQRYMRYISSFSSTSGTPTSRVDDVTMSAVSTGAYHSAVHSVGSNITSWRQLDATDSSVPSSRITYQVRSGSFSFSEIDDTIAWTAQTNHQTITAATNTYVQFRAISTIQSPTETVRLDQVVIRWQEGTEKPVASAVKDRRYFLSVTTSVNNADNDVTLVLQKNGKWTMFTGPSYYSLAFFDNTLYAGDSSTNSFVWKLLQADTYNDDGAAIKSKWITKDFTMDRPFQKKTLDDIWFEAAVSSGASLTIGFATDKSDAFTEDSVDLDVSSYSINGRVPAVDGFALGKYIKFRILNETKDEYFRLHSLGGFYTIQPMRRDDNE